MYWFFLLVEGCLQKNYIVEKKKFPLTILFLFFFFFLYTVFKKNYGFFFFKV